MLIRGTAPSKCSVKALTARTANQPASHGFQHPFLQGASWGAKKYAPDQGWKGVQFLAIGLKNYHWLPPSKQSVPLGVVWWQWVGMGALWEGLMATPVMSGTKLSTLSGQSRIISNGHKAHSEFTDYIIRGQTCQGFENLLKLPPTSQPAPLCPQQLTARGEVVCPWPHKAKVELGPWASLVAHCVGSLTKRVPGRGGHSVWGMCRIPGATRCVSLIQLGDDIFHNNKQRQ